MRMTKRKPVPVSEILREEFMKPLGLTQDELAKAADVSRRTVNELCNDRRAITADMAVRLSKVLGTSAEFWLGLQTRIDLWHALYGPDAKQKFARIRPVNKAA